jgi:hypothetical protein
VPLLSAFTPLGVLRLQSLPSEAEKIYNALVAGLGDGNYAVTPGSREDGWCYAWARCLAVVRLTLIHAGKQIEADCVTEFMGDREAEWQIVPGLNDSLITRRLTLAARKLLPRGARWEAVVDALSTLLGSDFVWYRTTKPAEIDAWPAGGAGAQPMNLQLPAVERKRIVITQPITLKLGSPQFVTYQLADPTQPALLVDDELVVQPENVARAERVTVTAVTPTNFQATFNGVHDSGCSATTMPWPAWTSSQRVDLVILTAAAALDPETRRKTNDLLERILRGVSTWGLVQQTGPNTAGPFTLDLSPLDATPLGTITFP